MIIYFSATGNSRYVAEQLAKSEEKIISIPIAIDTGTYEYYVEPNESVGIISPTYFLTIPSIVEEFLEKLKLNYSVRPYIYYVGTFGTTTGAAAAIANHYMKEKGCPFNAVFDVKMPDTWTPTYNLSDKEYVKKINRQADLEIQQLKKAVFNKIIGKHMHITMPYVAGIIGKHIYDNKVRYTSKLLLDDTCIGCGLCVEKCPAHAITMQDKHPVWVEKKCVMCLGCLHRCPKFAIQYGKKTKLHGQYQHP